MMQQQQQIDDSAEAAKRKHAKGSGVTPQGKKAKRFSLGGGGDAAAALSHLFEGTAMHRILGGVRPLQRLPGADLTSVCISVESGFPAPRYRGHHLGQ